MGYTPLEGLSDGSRSGLQWIRGLLGWHQLRAGLTVEDWSGSCRRRVGLRGLSGLSGDMRQLARRPQQQTSRAALALGGFPAQLLGSTADGGQAWAV